MMMFYWIKPSLVAPVKLEKKCYWVDLLLQKKFLKLIGINKSNQIEVKNIKKKINVRHSWNNQFKSIWWECKFFKKT